MNVPEINLEDFEKQKKQNFKERLEFIDKYVEWVKKNSNEKLRDQIRLVKAFCKAQD